MEADSKNKRGRPSVFVRDGFEELESDLKKWFPELESKRAITNQHYRTEGWGISQKAFGEEGHRERFSTQKGNLKGQAILEQIGRMRIQNGFSEEECIEALTYAVDTLWKQEGFSVKETAQVIRDFRNGKQDRKAEVRFRDKVSIETYSSVVDFCNERNLSFEMFLLEALEALEQKEGKEE